MAKALIGSRREASIGPNILMTAAQAGVLVNRRREFGTGSKYMRGLGEWVLQREAYVASRPEPVAEQELVGEPEEAVVDANAAADKILAELVELDLDVETEEVALA